MALNGDLLRTRAVNSGSRHRGNASCAATPAIECIGFSCDARWQKRWGWNSLGIARLWSAIPDVDLPVGIRRSLGAYPFHRGVKGTKKRELAAGEVLDDSAGAMDPGCSVATPLATTAAPTPALSS
jgi:hypothetical protein